MCTCVLVAFSFSNNNSFTFFCRSIKTNVLCEYEWINMSLDGFVCCAFKIYIIRDTREILKIWYARHGFLMENSNWYTTIHEQWRKKTLLFDWIIMLFLFFFIFFFSIFTPFFMINHNIEAFQAVYTLKLKLRNKTKQRKRRTIYFVHTFVTLLFLFWSLNRH